MTIQEAIGRVDALKFNTCPQGEKIRWLSELDGSIKHSILDRHEGGGGAFAGYDSNTDGSTVLLVPDCPYRSGAAAAVAQISQKGFALSQSADYIIP